ncbi:MAG: hypothetical protein KAG66_08760 [Methylococcales bacterium]|nr:hypothetical protein [Methylococcales bacterium]
MGAVLEAVDTKMLLKAVLVIMIVHAIAAFASLVRGAMALAGSDAWSGSNIAVLIVSFLLVVLIMTASVMVSYSMFACAAGKAPLSPLECVSMSKVIMIVVAVYLGMDSVLILSSIAA